MLVVKNLQVSVDGKPILKGIDLVVRPGEIHALMGPNGSGKSTFAYALMGHPHYKVKSQKSKVKIDGKNLLLLTPDQRAKLGLFLAFQYPVSIEGVSVRNFLRQVTEAFGPQPRKGVLEFRRYLIEYAKRLGISEELLGRSLNQGFSGGEKKRLEVLQMILLQPKIAILDEIDSGMDIDALKIVADGINRIMHKDRNMAIILITHYQRILRFIKPDFVHVIIDGRIVRSGGRKLAKELERKGYRQWLANSD